MVMCRMVMCRMVMCRMVMCRMVLHRVMRLAYAPDCKNPAVLYTCQFRTVDNPLVVNAL